MEKAQRKLTASISYAHQQVSAAAKGDFGKQYFARYQAPYARLQRAELDELCAVLVAVWQQEQQVLD